MSNLPNKFDVIIIGAGAAGLICAAESSKRHRNTLLIEHNKNIGEKIRISGGGRCNFTNLNISKENYHGNNPYFCISALTRFSNLEFIKLVEKHQIAYHEKTLGQLFCNNSAKDIINMLLNEANQNYCTLKTSTIIHDVTYQNNQFNVATSNGEFIAESLVIATGGLSIAKMGASNFGYKIAQKFKLNIIPTKPALVPFIFAPTLLNQTKILAGIAVKNVELSCNKRKFKEAILFTHKGLSGPAALQISSYWSQNMSLTINLLPEINFYEKLIQEKTTNKHSDIVTFTAKFIPKNLAKFFCMQHNISGSLNNISNKNLAKFSDNINNWLITPDNIEGYNKAEVTKGGIDTKEIDSKSFAHKQCKNLFFIGELLDITGHLGGYNFQWAWSSGYCAGQYC